MVNKQEEQVIDFFKHFYQPLFNLENSTPLGMILDHNLDSLIVLLQGINMTTAMQFGNTYYSFYLYCIPAIPFHIIAIEEYNTKAMKLPVINAASEGTISVAVVFALTAIFGNRQFGKEV